MKNFKLQLNRDVINEQIVQMLLNKHLGFFCYVTTMKILEMHLYKGCYQIRFVNTL